MSSLTITADDFGFSRSVNEAVLRAAEFGTLNAASLMTNMPFAEEAAATAQQRTPQLKLGLHFTLTSGAALAPKDEVHLLVDSHGHFRFGFGKLALLLYGKNHSEIKRQIRREFAAQLAEIDRLVEKYGIRLDHLDSHQHVHVLPGIFDILQDEADRRGWTLRIPRERFGSSSRFFQQVWSWGLTGLLKQKILNYFLPPIIGRDYFGILDTGKMDATAWKAILTVIKKSAVEINMHPSLEPGVDEATWRCSAGDRLFHRSAWRRKEFDVLVNEEFRKQILDAVFPLAPPTKKPGHLSPIPHNLQSIK
jgi:predicted glycoside hydrolase/deacetylase ChbG (UPF0249 family)